MTYAKELVADGATLTDANLAVRTKLGFGVSSAVTRYLRFDLTNATWANAVVPARLDVGVSPTGTSYTPLVAVVQGGSTSDSYAIFKSRLIRTTTKPMSPPWRCKPLA